VKNITTVEDTSAAEFKPGNRNRPIFTKVGRVCPLSSLSLYHIDKWQHRNSL